MFSRFFVRRPVFARVIAILIMLAGCSPSRRCRWRNILTSPSGGKISATYTGASAETRKTASLRSLNSS